MTRKNKTKGKKAKNGDEPKKPAPQKPTPQQSLLSEIHARPQIHKKDEFLGFVKPTELQHAQRYFNEEKRKDYKPPESRIDLPKAPECAELDETKEAEMFDEIERLTYPLPSTNVHYIEYIEYRQQVMMHGVKTNEELISIINYHIEWLEAVNRYIVKCEEQLYGTLPRSDDDVSALDSLLSSRETYWKLRKDNGLEEEVFRTMRYMTNYLDKEGVEASLTEPYFDSVESYLKTHPAEAKWMLGFTRGIYFSDYTRLLPCLFSGPIVHFQSKLVEKYGEKFDKDLLVETDMIRYERDRHLLQLSICRRWLLARMVSLRPKYLTGGLERYLKQEPNAQKSTKLKLAYTLASSRGKEPSLMNLSLQLREYVFDCFKKETGIDYKDIYVFPDDTPEEIEKKEELKNTLLKKYDPATMSDALGAILQIKDAYHNILDKKQEQASTSTQE